MHSSKEMNLTRYGMLCASTVVHEKESFADKHKHHDKMVRHHAITERKATL